MTVVVDFIKNINAVDFAALYRSDHFKQSKLIDVREPYEWEAVRLKKACLIPMNFIPERLDQLEKDKELFILCAHGVRSVYVAQYLVRQGYRRVYNVVGGMAAVESLLDDEVERGK